MNEAKDIKLYTKLQKLTSLFQRISQLSWTSDQTKKRYPFPEAMTSEEMKALITAYSIIGTVIDDIYEEWKGIQNEK